MSAALQTVELSPEAVALIKEGTPKPRAAGVTLAATPVKADEVELSTELEKANNAYAEPPSPSRKKTSIAKESAAPLLVSTVHTSFRLAPEIPSALLRASLDRKLQRIKPWTQQDIAAEALTLWLTRHGYLS
ncbi:MAG: hypothetical protein ABIQ35_01710 [Verrucomicrobiota bacterium]